MFTSTRGALAIHLPASISRQGSTPALAISTKLSRQLDPVRDQAFFVSTLVWQFALYRSMRANTRHADRKSSFCSADDRCRPVDAKGL
jgi:hypothetical protein